MVAPVTLLRIAMVQRQWSVLKGVNDSNQVDSTTLYTDEAAVWTVYCNYATHSNRKPLMLMDTLLGLKSYAT